MVAGLAVMTTGLAVMAAGLAVMTAGLAVVTTVMTASTIMAFLGFLNSICPSFFHTLHLCACFSFFFFAHIVPAFFHPGTN